MTRMHVGLHLTKCAGTSLATTVRLRLGEDCYFLCSSYYENLISGRPLFEDIESWDRIQFIFGHYVSEDLIASLRGYKPLLFTMIRDPSDRVISEFLHMQAVALESEAKSVSVSEFMARSSNSMCVELLRCFPSVDRLLSELPLHAKAAYALAIFDYVGTTESAESSINWILKSMELDVHHHVRDNITANRLKEHNFNSEVMLLREQINSFAGEDIALYQVVLPHVGMPGFGESLIAQLNSKYIKNIKRDDFISDVLIAEGAKSRYSDFEYRYLCAEMHATGRVDWCRELFRRKEHLFKLRAERML